MRIGKLIIRVLGVALHGNIRDVLDSYHGDIVVELSHLAYCSYLHIEQATLNTKAALDLANDVGIHERVARKYCLRVGTSQGAWVGNLGAEALGNDSVVVYST